MRPSGEIEACRSSHRRLIADVVRLTEDDFRSPSLLPRFSRAHVVTHIANKAKAHTELFGGAAAGEVRRLHADGHDPDTAADSGADRSATDLCSDLEQSLVILEAAWDALDDDHWDREGIMMAGPRSMAEIVGHHLRN